MDSGRLASVSNGQLNHRSSGVDCPITNYFFTGFFFHTKITGLAMKIVE